MALASSDLIDWRDREYVSQFSLTPLELSIYIGGVLADPDSSLVSAQLLLQNPDGTVQAVNTYTASRLAAGMYQVTPSTSDVSVPSNAELVWSYSVSAAPQQYATYIVIGPANPNYDALPLDMKDFMESQIWVRFADLFDSPDGGPNLQTYFQAHWSRGRMAQLLIVSINKINSVAQPWSNYTADGNMGPEFPIMQWGGLLASYTYCEAVKHLIRGYVEQPNLVGAGVTRLDRRDYADRWREVLKDEQAELKSMLDTFKIRHMGLGNPRVLVSGGTYGRYAPTRIAGSVAARPRMWARWY